MAKAKRDQREPKPFNPRGPLAWMNVQVSKWDADAIAAYCPEGVGG